MKRTAKEVVQEWRDSGSQDWEQLISAINYWAMTDICPELTSKPPALTDAQASEILFMARALSDKELPVAIEEMELRLLGYIEALMEAAPAASGKGSDKC